MSTSVRMSFQELRNIRVFLVESLHIVHMPRHDLRVHFSLVYVLHNVCVCGSSQGNSSSFSSSSVLHHIFIFTITHSFNFTHYVTSSFSTNKQTFAIGLSMMLVFVFKVRLRTTPFASFIVSITLPNIHDALGAVGSAINTISPHE